MFGKFMNKKFFHPGSYPNVKMRWIHEQRDAAKKKQEEEKQSTYQKEQESYQSRMLSAKTTEEKMKLDLNFLYDLPPGMKIADKEEEEDKEVEVKFEWQKHAPRSKYINDLGLDCQDQPFGVCVRNIRCFKCRAWGHQNTDRECPLFFSNVNSEAEGNVEGKRNLRLSDPLLLVGAMKQQHGISLKKSVIGKEIDPMADNQLLIPSDDEIDDELGTADLEFVESLTDKQKRRLLKRLNELEKDKHKHKKKKKSKHKKKSEDRNYLSSSEDDIRYRKKQKSSHGYPSEPDDSRKSKKRKNEHSTNSHIDSNRKKYKEDIDVNKEYNSKKTEVQNRVDHIDKERIYKRGEENRINGSFEILEEFETGQRRPSGSKKQNKEISSSSANRVDKGKLKTENRVYTKRKKSQYREQEYALHKRDRETDNRDIQISDSLKRSRENAQKSEVDEHYIDEKLYEIRKGTKNVKDKDR